MPIASRKGQRFNIGAHVLTAIGVAVFPTAAAVSPDTFRRWLRKDSADGAGLAENLTVLVLVMGIVAAIIALARWWRRFPDRRLALWLGVWTLACVYFAGEECSWGQWWIGWETPAALDNINNQGEMNLHNISSWLDQKPRAMVEVFIIIAGFLAPLGLRLARRSPPPSSWLHWILAPSACWSAAGALLLFRVIDKTIEDALLASSELQELAIAWFLALYLMSYFVRLSFREPASDAGVAA